MKLEINQAAKVQIYSSKDRKSFWHPCTVTGFTSAMDREYRINIILKTGAEIFECAPECVRAA